MIKSIKIFSNNNDKSFNTSKILEDKFIKNGFILKDDSFDLGIAVGGDGSFLRMVKSTNFASNPFYIGVNTGTLGFMQEVHPSKIDDIIAEILEEKYKINEIGIQETDVISNKELYKYNSLNEIVVRGNNFRVINMDVKIDDDYLESYKGDGLILATSCGSTAHNKSYAGSIVYNNFSTLQITPMGRVESNSYNSLENSVIIPSNMEIKLIPADKNKDYNITVDGENELYDKVDEIKTSIKDKKIKMLRFSHYSFTEKINEKFIRQK
jgi:NAD+ kinase